MENILYTENTAGVACLTLNDPEAGNALDDGMVSTLEKHLGIIEKSPSLRALVLRGSGDAFCLGVKKAWLKEPSSGGHGDALRSAALLRRLAFLPKPVVTCVQGPAVALGVALAAVSDFVLTTPGAYFQVPHARLGLVAASLAPYLVAAVGPKKAKAWMLSGMKISALDAREAGLVDKISPREALEENLEILLRETLKGGPSALALSKQLVREVAFASAQNVEVQMAAAKRFEQARSSAEGMAGVAAFLHGHPPPWWPPDKIL